MSTYNVLDSSCLQLKDPAGGEQILRGAIKSCMQQYAVQVEPGTKPGEFALCFQGDVGESFAERVKSLAAAIGPLLAAPGQLMVRQDSISDDRDQVFFAGPTPESILQYRQRQVLVDADDLLRSAFDKEDVHAALGALKATAAARAGVRMFVLLDPACNQIGQPQSQFDPAWMRGGARSLVPHIMKCAPGSPVAFEPALSELLEHAHRMDAALFASLVELEKARESSQTQRHRNESFAHEQSILRGALEAAPWRHDPELGVVYKRAPAARPREGAGQ